MTTLPLFWHLSSASKKERIDASVKLVGSLEQFQGQFLPKATCGNSGSEDEDNEDEEEDEEEENNLKPDGLDLLNAQDVSYSIRRLIRGLASPRESSRLGFAVALTELLSRIDTVTCSQILSLITDTTKHQGSMSGQEERDVLFARLFGITSVIQSDLAIRTKPLSASASSTTAPSSVESYEQIILQLISISEQKSWLRESAWFTLNLAIDALHGSDVPWKSEAVEKILDILFVSNKVWSTEKLAVALKLQELYPERDWKLFLSPTFKNPDLLSSGNLLAISRLLKESTTDEDGLKDPSKAPSGAWKPQLNFSWDLILDQMLPGPDSKKPARGSFQDFYRVAVDESLFSSTSSPQRKFWGFQVFQKALKRVTEENMPMLFTKNFMRSWINHLSKKDRYLHKVAVQTATEVQAFVQNKPQLGFALILQLTGVNGSQQFDKLTKTKTVESILSALDAKGIQSYVDYLITQLDEPEANSSNIAGINSRRAWVIEQMGALIRNGKVPKEDGWIQTILDWLAIHGLFSIRKKNSKSPFAAVRSVPTPVLSDEFRRSCRERLLGCLSDLTNQTSVVQAGDKSTKISAVATDGEFWISKVLSTIHQVESDTKHALLLLDLDEGDISLLQKAQKAVDDLKQVMSGNQEAARGAQLLILSTVLQSYCAGDDNELVDPDALQSCIEGTSRLLLQSSGKPKDMDKKYKESKAALEEPSEEPIDVLVDTIIGYLEKSTAYMRAVSNQVFSLLSGSLKETTIDLIVTQLESRDPNQLAEDEDEDMEDLESDDEADEDQDSDSDSEAEGSNEEESAEENDAEVSELRNKIEEALRVNGIEPATGDTDDEDEELMDDDQMMAIDEQLVEVFRSRTSEKKSGKDVNAQREATHFKNRILDLVDTFIKKQPTSPLILRLITPLVELVATSAQDEQQLVDKAKGILRSRFGKAKDLPTSVTIKDVLPVATNLHLQARRVHSSDILSILSLCSVYLTRIAVYLSDEDASTDLYRQSLKDFTTRKHSTLNIHFFQEYLRRFPNQSWSLRQDILEAAKNAINTYRQCQTLQLADLLVNSLSSMHDKDKEAAEFLQNLRQVTLDLAVVACASKPTLSTTQMKDLFKLVLTATRQTRRILPASMEATWQPEGWASLQEKLTSSPRFKAATALHKMCEHVVRATKSVEEEPSQKKTKSSKTKRKVEEINGKDETVDDDPKKYKRKRVKGDRT